MARISSGTNIVVQFTTRSKHNSALVKVQRVRLTENDHRNKLTGAGVRQRTPLLRAKEAFRSGNLKETGMQPGTV